jgi:hypothetical protein
MGEMERRATKRIMRSLDVIGEHDDTNQQSLEECAKIFIEPLSASNLEALAALFGWNHL